MNAAQRTKIGVGMVVCGVVLTLIALPLGWSAIQRWLAISEVHAAQIKFRSGHVDEARRLAEKASARVPHKITPILIAIDPTQVVDLDRVQAIMPQIRRSDDRLAAVATVALGRALLGVPIGVDLGDGADAKLITGIIALRGGKEFTLSSDTSGDAPHRAVQRVAWMLALQRALELKQADHVGRFSGMLMALCPSDVQVRVWRFLAGACSVNITDKDLIYLGEQVPEQQRKAVIKSIIQLFPAKQSVFAARWPNDLTEFVP